MTKVREIVLENPQYDRVLINFKTVLVYTLEDHKEYRFENKEVASKVVSILRSIV